MMYEIKALAQVSFAELADTHNQAFADYVVPMKTTPEQLETYFKIVGVDLSQSFGAFYKNKLIGMIVNGIDLYKGETVAWDTMTCIVREHRGKGLFSKLFASTRKCLKENGIQKYYLDVITTNEKAYLAYKNKGMRIVREFTFLTGRVERISADKENVSLSPLPTSMENELAFYEPSFQNRMLGLCRINRNYQVAKHGNVEVLVSSEGRITQIRYQGEEDKQSLNSILSCLSERFDTIDISNIPTTEKELLSALPELGFAVKVKQYEMCMEL